jgi:ribulose-5-phosphate 4-epimerase/fuculose-1-phosphate aldolase
MPSVETGMHISVYKNRPDVNAVIHTHQPYASIFSLILQAIPALFDEQVANLGREVAVVPYGLSGSNDLLTNITKALENQCNAYILQNHGVLVLGLDMMTVSRNTMILEKTAQVYYQALLSGKDVVCLTAEIEETIFSMLKSNQRKEIRRKKKLRREK